MNAEARSKERRNVEFQRDLLLSEIGLFKHDLKAARVRVVGLESRVLRLEQTVAALDFWLATAGHPDAPTLEDLA